MAWWLSKSAHCSGREPDSFPGLSSHTSGVTRSPITPGPGSLAPLVCGDTCNYAVHKTTCRHTREYTLIEKLHQSFEESA